MPMSLARCVNCKRLVSMPGFTHPGSVAGICHSFYLGAEKTPDCPVGRDIYAEAHACLECANDDTKYHQTVDLRKGSREVCS